MFLPEKMLQCEVDEDGSVVAIAVAAMVLSETDPTFDKRRQY
jgi:hypothetical protein